MQMWKYAATLLICLVALSNPAGSAFWQGQTYASSTPLPRGDVICDVTTGVATGTGAGTCATTPAVCNGDVTTVTTNITTVDFGSTVTVFSNTFVGGDVGKKIAIPGSGAPTTRTITSVGAFNGTSQAVGVAPVLRANITNQPSDVSYGTDDAPAFATFSDWALRTWQASYSGLIEMYLPPGKTCQMLTDAPLTPTSNYDPKCVNSGTTYWAGFCAFGGTGWSRGIKKFLMNFPGSSVVAPIAFSRGFVLASGVGVCQAGIAATYGCSARTASASIGDTSVFLQNTSLCSRFTAGDYMFMTGYDTQGLWQPTGGYSFPPNPAFYDHVKITSMANCATGMANGRIDFDRPLTNNYLSTWPLNGPGNNFEADQGGPATVYSVPTAWDTEVEYRGGTFGRQSQLTNDAGRKITFRDITWSATPGSSGIGCAYATQNTDWTIIGGNWTQCVVETDKIVVNMTIQNGTMYRMDNQSISPRNMSISNSVVDIFNGTGRNFTGSNVTVTSTAAMGPIGYGRGDSWSCTNCSLAGGPSPSTLGTSGSVSSGTWNVNSQGLPQAATMTGGVITIPVQYGAVWWAVPGTNFTWGPPGTQSAYVYQIASVTQDPTNQYITTNCVGTNTVCGSGGSFPATSGTLFLRVHPAPKFNCVGCAAAGSSRPWSAVSDGPTDAPVFSYVNYNMDVTWPTSNSNPLYQFVMWGKLVGITATVNTPYAGGGVLNYKPTQQFVYGVVGQTGTSGSYVPSIDLKTGGTRTLLPNGTGGTGADSNTTPFAAPLWFAGSMSGVISSQPAWAGNAQITITTDQGVVNP